MKHLLSTLRSSAMLLAFTLIFSFGLPGIEAISAAAGSTEEPIVYTLKRGITGSVDLRTMTGYGTRNWAYVENTVSHNPEKDPVMQLQSSLQLRAIYNGEWVALKIDIPRAGIYSTEIEYMRNYYGGAIMGTYIFPLIGTATKTSIAAGIAENTSLGDVICFDGSVAASYSEEKTLAPVRIVKPGEYLLVFRASGMPSGSKARTMFPVQITLTPQTSYSTPQTLASDAASRITVSGAEGVTASVGGESLPVNGEAQQVGIGDEIAFATERSDFQYWKNAASGHILSTDRSFSFLIGTDTEITAVFATPSGSDAYRVEFINKNGRILSQSIVNKNSYVTGELIPTPFSYGSECVGWSLDPATTLITQDTVFIAVYENDPPIFNIIVNGGSVTASEALYTYNSSVTVTAGEPPENEQFLYWLRDGKIVSYDAAYTFNLWGDTTLDAVFGVNAPVKIPQVSLDSYKKLTEEGKTLFCSCRTVPDGFTEIESGILTHTDETIDISVFTGKGVARTRSTQLSTYVESLSGVWVRAYLIYRDDEDGALYIAYSDPLQSI